MINELCYGWAFSSWTVPELIRLCRIFGVLLPRLVRRDGTGKDSA